MEKWLEVVPTIAGAGRGEHGWAELASGQGLTGSVRGFCTCEDKEKMK